MTNPEQVNQLKEEILRWIFSILGALLTFLAVACVIRAIYHPDAEQLKKAAAEILIEPASVRPEPVEALLFRLAVIIIPACILMFYVLLAKLSLVRALTSKHYYLTISALCVAFLAGLIYFDFTALNPFGLGNGDFPQNSRDQTALTNFDFYFDGIFLGSYFWLYVLLIVPSIICLFFIGIKKYQWENSKYFRLISSSVLFAISGCSIVAVVLMNTYNFPCTNESKLDFDAVYYSMTQVYAGVPMLADHLTNTYGLYPQFLNPLFHIIGLTVFKFSLIMALLTGLSFTLNFFCLRQLVSNKIILFLGFTSLLFFTYFDFMVTTIFDSIFALFPVRYIIPSVLSCLAAFYFKKPTQRKYWVISFASALFILWNPEIGMVCYIAWMATNIYYDYYTNEGLLNKKKITFHVLSGMGTLIAASGIYELSVFLFSGTWPDLKLLFGTILVFEKLGLGLLPMAAIHPWNLTAIILTTGFTWSIVKWYNKDVSYKSTLVLLISLIGLGYFVYFQGRSHNSNFALSSGFSLLLLTVLGDELWKKVKETNLFLLNGLFVIFLFLVSFSFVEILSNSKKIVEIVYHEEDKNKDANVQKIIENNTDFIVKNTHEHEKILVLTQRRNQALFFDGNKRPSAFNPGLVDLFLKTDVARLEDILADSSFSVFTEPGSNARYQFLTRSMSIIGAAYECTDANETMVLLKKRKSKMSFSPFFKNVDSTIFYRKYTDDRTGVVQRANDGMGVDSVNIGPRFSVELFFYSAPQFYSKATLVGNVHDSSGFTVGNIINSSKYYFGINSRAAIVNIPYNKWVYAAMTVYPDHMEVYIDGELTITHPLAQPMRRSSGKLYVGNLGMYEYFVGPVSEIAITGKVLDSGQIRATWNEIRKDNVVKNSW